MSESLPAVENVAHRLQRHRACVAGIRERARHLLVGGANGIQVAAAISHAIDAFLVELTEEALGRFTPRERKQIEQHSAIVAIGGTGRGDMAPCSDVDLLFLYRGRVRDDFSQCAAQIVRDCWDAGIKLGHSVRTPADAINMARREPQFATALVEARCLFGHCALADRLKGRFFRKVVRRRLRSFVEDCISNRRSERAQHGATACELEPDVKRSLGGLRDVHVIRWIGAARFGTADIEPLRLEGALNKDDARRLLAAQEFLTRIRIDLHLAAGKPQDRLTREEQLRLADEWHVLPTPGQRAVERFMQTYFQHSTAVADIAERFIARHRPRTFAERTAQFITTHHADGIFRVGCGAVDVAPRRRDQLCARTETLLKLYQTAALNNVQIAPELIDAVKHAVPKLNAELSPEAAQLFLEIIDRSGHLGPTVRGLYETGLLETVLPELKHTRCLLQFNQYHSYTVDEHTLRAIEAAQNFEHDAGPVGTAYRSISRKRLLHLALLLHDAGKGFEEDHSEVGRRLAEAVAARFQLPDHQRDALVFLVHKHLLMSHLAFRRDISDPVILLHFAHEVGSPETLRMLYVLTAADLTAVGPGVWTDWKADLLAELFDRTMLILSGKHHRFLEEERMRHVKQTVKASFVPLAEENGDWQSFGDWVDRQLDAFTPHYLTTTPPERIAADLQIIRELKPGEIAVEGCNDPETGTVDYRILTDQKYAAGCSHRIAGVLTAKRLEILSAQITTSLDGIVVDVFRVLDNDHAGEVPPFRMEEIAEAIREVLIGRTTVKNLFQRSRRFDDRHDDEPLSRLPTRVVIDNDSSDRCTVIDVFAHDRPGLLYTISRRLFKLGLSVELAKISTHFDQVVDVFYVTDADGEKIRNSERLHEIRNTLLERLTEFERDGHVQFV